MERSTSWSLHTTCCVMLRSSSVRPAVSCFRVLSCRHYEDHPCARDLYKGQLATGNWRRAPRRARLRSWGKSLWSNRRDFSPQQILNCKRSVGGVSSVENGHRRPLRVTSHPVEGSKLSNLTCSVLKQEKKYTRDHKLSTKSTGIGERTTRFTSKSILYQSGIFLCEYHTCAVFWHGNKEWVMLVAIARLRNF